MSGCTFMFNSANAGFGAANNRGARASHGDLLMFLNNDTLVRTEILPQIESHFATNPSCGAAGLQLLNTDGTAQYSTGKFPTPWSEWRMSRRHNLYKAEDTVRRDWVSGAAMVVRRTVFEEVGGFDYRYFMYFEDVDLCARIRGAGHEIHYLPGISVEHLRAGASPAASLPLFRLSTGAHSFCTIPSMLPCWIIFLSGRTWLAGFFPPCHGEPGPTHSSLCCPFDNLLAD